MVNGGRSCEWSSAIDVSAEVIEGYERRIAELEAIVEAQVAPIERLEARIGALERERGRNSGNSSLPPSRDDAEARAALAARRQAKREAGKRAPGKQRGDPGSHLARVEDPDRVVRRIPHNVWGMRRRA